MRQKKFQFNIKQVFLTHNTWFMIKQKMYWTEYKPRFQRREKALRAGFLSPLFKAGLGFALVGKIPDF